MDVNVTVQPNEKGQIEIVHRTGEAAKPEVKQAVSLSGSIDSVVGFEQKRASLINKDQSHLIMNEEKREVIFVVNESDRVRHTISGSMKVHPYITELGINNQDKEYNLQQLIKVLKLNRRYFNTRTEHAQIVAALLSFSARTETEFENSNNLKGTAAFKFIQKVTHEVPLNFEMKVPIFVGEKPDTFKVDVEVTPENGSLTFQLVSVELMEKMDALQTDKWKGVEEHFEDYVIIKQ